MKIRHLGAKRHHTWNIRGWISARKGFLGLAFLPGANLYREVEDKQSTAERVIPITSWKFTLSWLCFAFAVSHSSITASDYFHMQAIQGERFGFGIKTAPVLKKKGA